MRRTIGPKLFLNLNFHASLISREFFYFYNFKEKSFRPSLFCYGFRSFKLMSFGHSYWNISSVMRLRKNFGAILHPRVRNILSHELATNTIWHFRHLIFHIWKGNGGIHQKKRNVLFTGLEKCLIFTFCRIKQR